MTAAEESGEVVEGRVSGVDDDGVAIDGEHFYASLRKYCKDRSGKGRTHCYCQDHIGGHVAVGGHARIQLTGTGRIYKVLASGLATGEAAPPPPAEHLAAAPALNAGYVTTEVDHRIGVLELAVRMAPFEEPRSVHELLDNADALYRWATEGGQREPAPVPRRLAVVGATPELDPRDVPEAFAATNPDEHRETHKAVVTAVFDRGFKVQGAAGWLYYADEFSGQRLQKAEVQSEVSYDLATQQGHLVVTAIRRHSR